MYVLFNSSWCVIPTYSSSPCNCSALCSWKPGSDDVVLSNTAHVSWAHWALEVPSKARCDWSGSSENKTASSGESQVEQPAEAFSCFKDEKQENQKPGSFKDGGGVEGGPQPLWGPDPPPCQATATAAVKRTLVDLAPLDVSTAVNDNTNRPQHLVLPTRASCRLPACVYVLSANAAAPSLGPRWSAETALGDSSTTSQQHRLPID